jgi:hypothetical protein
MSLSPKDAATARYVLGGMCYEKMEKLVQGKSVVQRLASIIQAESSVRQGLMCLDLSKCGVGDKGAAFLAPEMPRLLALRTLRLMDDGITDICEPSNLLRKARDMSPQLFEV